MIWFNALVPPGNTERPKLAAILFTDVAGYSALSPRNDQLALEFLAKTQKFNSGK